MISTEAEYYRPFVARGAALLDEKEPGWADRVDLGVLDIHNPCLCVLGQVCGQEASGIPGRNGYNVGVLKYLDKPGRYPTEVAKHGFNVSDVRQKRAIMLGGPSASLYNLQHEYALLQEAWVELILARRVDVKTHAVAPVPVTA